MHVRVLGGGVVGLTTAIALSSQGHEVEIVAEKVGIESSSRLAAAIWHLFLIDIDEKVERWGRETVSELIHLAADAQSGVIMRRGVEYLRTDTGSRVIPKWASLVPHFAWLANDQLPPGVAAAYEVEVPLADMSIYLPWLEVRARKNVQKIRRARIDSLNEATQGVEVLVNCSGFAARELANDPAVVPAWGQVVYVDRPPGLDYYVGDDDNPEGMTYVLPRVNDVVLGGAAIYGRVGESIDDRLAHQIIARCEKLVPALRGAKVRAVAAGVRPCREGGIRVELSRPPAGAVVIHNYGHGGSGFSLSWGCAYEICRIVASLSAC